MNIIHIIKKDLGVAVENNNDVIEVGDMVRITKTYKSNKYKDIVCVVMNIITKDEKTYYAVDYYGNMSQSTKFLPMQWLREDIEKIQ